MAKRIYLSPSNQYANTYSFGNTTEMEQCNKIAVAAEAALKRCGFTVKRAPKGQNMYTSINESNAFKADVHVCIHTNAGGGRGTNVFVYNNSDTNLKYAKPVYNELVKLTGNGRGIKTYPELAEINQTNAKCVYCECEFHDNATLAKWIINNTTKIGEAIAKGLCKAFGVAYKTTTSTTSSKKVLDSQGYKKGQTSDGVLAIKELLLLAKTLKIHSQGMDENGGFGDGTEKAVNGLLKKWGYKPNGIAGDNFIKKLTAEIRKKI